MGNLVDWWVKARRRVDPLASAQDLGIVSPWAPPTNLSPLIANDVIPTDVRDRFPLQRAEAMRIPAVAKLRNLLVSTISPLPLVSLARDSDEKVADQPSFLQRTNGLQAPEDRTAASVDDLLFYGATLWQVERGAGASPVGGPILSGWWLPFEQWDIRVVEGRFEVFIDDELADPRTYLLFNVPLFDGLLSVGSRTIRGARDIEEAWVARAKNPVPMLKMTVANDVTLEQEELDAMAKSWTQRHTSSSPSVGILPEGVDIQPIGQVATDFFQAARNASRGDVGSFANVNAAMLDGTSGVNSLTYTTKDGERSIFLTEAVPMWTTPFHARLSMDDVVPSGQRIRFDQTALQNQPTPTGTPTED